MTPDELTKLITEEFYKLDENDCRAYDLIAKAGVWAELRSIRLALERWERKNYGRH
jgi:hypothetical protein